MASGRKKRTASSENVGSSVRCVGEKTQRIHALMPPMPPSGLPIRCREAAAVQCDGPSAEAGAGVSAVRPTGTDTSRVGTKIKGVSYDVGDRNLRKRARRKSDRSDRRGEEFFHEGFFMFVLRVVQRWKRPPSMAQYLHRDRRESTEIYRNFYAWDAVHFPTCGGAYGADQAQAVGTIERSISQSAISPSDLDPCTPSTDADAIEFPLARRGGGEIEEWSKGRRSGCWSRESTSDRSGRIC